MPQKRKRKNNTPMSVFDEEEYPLLGGRSSSDFIDRPPPNVFQVCCMAVIDKCKCFLYRRTVMVQLSEISLSKIQQKRMLDLRQRAGMQFDRRNPEHRKILRSFGMVTLGEEYIKAEKKLQK